MKPFAIFIFLLTLSCTEQKKNVSVIGNDKPEITKDSNYIWTKLKDSSDWKKNYNFQMFSCRDTLWTFHPNGNWFSTDGTNWTKSELPNAIHNLAFLDYIQFKDAIYGLGHFEGNIETFSFKPEIYKTTNFKHWETISTQSNLPQRFFYHPFVFDNKIWIIGGEDKNSKYADIWNSSDGINWTKQKDSLPFGKRSGSQIVQLNDHLYLLDNDVWQSSDGLNWQKISAEIIPGVPIFGYTALVYDNNIWLLGCNRNGQFSNQVLFSTDGKNWQTQNAPWLPRGGIAATVFNNKIYMTGGKYGGTPNHPDFRYDNDLWTMHKSN